MINIKKHQNCVNREFPPNNKSLRTVLFVFILGEKHGWVFPLTDTIFQTTMSFVYRYISFPWKIDCQTACCAFRVISKMQILCLKNATHGESRLTPAGKIYLIFFSLCFRVLCPLKF